MDVLLVGERINHGLCFGKQYYYFGKHFGPFGKLRYFIAEANQTRDIRVSINHSYTDLLKKTLLEPKNWLFKSKKLQKKRRKEGVKKTALKTTKNKRVRSK